MFLRELFEAEKKMASFALGRLNPATSGHELLVNAIKKAPGDSFLFLTDRAPKLPTDPLTPQDKLDWARKSFDGISIGLAKTVLTAADRLYKMGYTEITFLEGEPKLLKILKQYNGQEKEMHNYNFQKIDYVQLQRDADANDATGMSASKLRQTVLDNDIDAFKGGVTKQAMPHAEEMFKKLQGLMGVDSIEESTDNDKLLKALKKKLKDEGGAAGFDPLKDVASKMDIDLTPAKLKSMPGIKQHRDGDYILEEKDLDPITLQRVLKFAADRDRSDARSKDARISMPGTDELIAKARAQAKRDRVTNVPAHAHDKDGVHKQGFKKVKFDPVELSPELKVQLGLGRSGKMKLNDAGVKPGSALPKTIKPIKMPTPPKAPTGPDGKDENGVTIGTTPKGNRSVKSGAGTYIFTPKGKLMLYMTPKMGGLQQTHNIAKKTITVNFTMDAAGATVDQKGTYDMSGKLISGDNTSIGSGNIKVGMDKDKGTSMDYKSMSGKDFKFSSQDPENVKKAKMAAFKKDGEQVRAAFKKGQDDALKKAGIK